MDVQARAKRVRQAFRDQATYCAKLGSPFTAAICEMLADTLSTSDAAGRAILSWPGDPAPPADNVPLRVAGALHALARSGRVQMLSAAYPPRLPPSRQTLSVVLATVLAEHAAEIVEFLRFTPQTNEVGRSGALIGGFLAIAQRTGLPLDLYEIGASAGLNLLADRYRYKLGPANWGSKRARLTLEPQWTGAAPPSGARLVIRARRGCDIHPIDVRDPVQRERLKSYIWPDQTDRLERLDAAIATALDVPFALDRADAADWVTREIAAPAEAGVARVLFHSIVWTYLPYAARERIEKHVAAVGAASREDAPFAWLRLEFDVPSGESQLRLNVWPGGDEQMLAGAHPHGAWVRWTGAA
jgi:hypothetical protein